ncbi:MAG: hypothetical protein A2201_00795 [Alicyclobacillus sp. RIFOXYA1_FULL_53_8]|nr:MAG: hypothetical protein A2201_00795 [Alicyclobacillus sp. RIFOXYA1_FULL_53_8]
MRVRQLLLVNILVILIVALVLGGGYWYFYNQNNYISESDAYVNVQVDNIVATATGKLTKWTIAEGQSVQAGDVVGTEELPTGQTVNITAPNSGQFLKVNAVADQVVAAGALLGVEANLDNEYIRANIKETVIRDVKVGQTVDVYMDAFPGTTFSGTVQSIGVASAAQTSLFPPSQSSANFSKEVQRIPVIIALNGKEGKTVLPRMNVTVRIHKN